MSKSNAKKLVDKLAKDKKFRDALLAEEVKVALKFAKKAGLECTPEELKEISGAGQWTADKVGRDFAQYLPSGVELSPQLRQKIAEGIIALKK